MAYKVVLTNSSVKVLNEIEKPISSLIISWLKHNLQGCYNPRALGYQLEKLNYNYWKYRIGNYRILTLIKDDSLVILDIVK